MAILTKAMATKSCQRGHSPVTNGALSVPIIGMAITRMALVAGGKLRTRPNQAICAKPQLMRTKQARLTHRAGESCSVGVAP